MSLVIIQLKFGDRVILSPILENITETIQEVEKKFELCEMDRFYPYIQIEEI